MKRLTCSGVLLVLVIFCRAQTELPPFGSVTAAEKDLKECPFDKEADVVVLLDEATSSYDDDHRLITNHRIRMKVLKQKGIRHADVSIPYYHKDDFEYISEVNAYTLNVKNGIDDIRKVSNSSIYRKKMNDVYSVATFAFPDVQPGSILEYQFTSTKKHYGGLEDWFFHHELPVQRSCYTLSIPPTLEFAYRVFKSEQYDIIIKNEKGTGRVYFEMNNIPGLRDEPFMDSEKDYLQHVEFQLSGIASRFGGTQKYMTTWEEVTRTLMQDRDFGLQLNKNFAGSEAIFEKVKTMKPFEKMEAIYLFVQKGIEWNGYKGIYALNGVKEAWEKKKGSTGQINLLLINMLKEAGLEVYPLLVSERGHGKVHPEYPFVDQFNNVMAYVVIDNKTYVLDGAGVYTPAFMIPFSVINTKAFVVHRKKGGIITLTDDTRMERNLVVIEAKVDQNGALHGDATVNSSEYARLNRLRAWYRNKEKFKENYFTGYSTGLQLDSIELKNIENDSIPLEQHIQFSIPPTESGGYKLINLNLFSGITKSPFISDVRFTNIDYGCMQQQSVIQEIALPGNMTIENLPRNVRMIMPDTSIVLTRAIEVNKSTNTMSVRLNVQIKRSVFTADEYGYVKEFYKKMADLMNEQLVLKPNN